MINPWNALFTLAIQASETATDAVTNAVSKVAENAPDVGAVAGEATNAAGSGVSDAVAAALVFLKVILILGLPVFLGVVIAQALKMKEYAGRISACLLALSIAVAPLALAWSGDKPLDEILRLGIDLAGGANLVYEVEHSEEKPITDALMDKMVGAVGIRINPSGQEEITVRRVGADRIEVIVPGKDPATVDAIKAKIVRLGTLEFYITAHHQEDQDIVVRAEKLDNATKDLRNPASGNVEARWMPAYLKNNEPQFLQRSDAVRRSVKAERPTETGMEEYETQEYLLLVDPKEQRVSGKYLTSAGTALNPDNGTQMVTFRFNQQGAYLFGQLTGRHKPRAGHPERGLAIVLDGHVQSAPAIRDTITSSGQITGDFTPDEARELTSVLNAGALEVPINPKPLSEATVDPTLGEDVRNKGIQAIMIAAVSVVGFMLLYYRAAGLIAILCLIMNLVLVLSTMMLIEATFTLPGLAGLVLTIGMAVDANVLIFERIREEQRRGSSLRMAIRNGFSKALSTIIDANLTTLLTAVILFMIGTDQVRGFAVTLFIGIVMSMFTALFVSRTIFDIAEKKRWIKKLAMFSFVGETNWDFVGKRVVAAMLSVVLIGIGLTAFFTRGARNYDIDFTGGTMVTFQLEEVAETDAVRDVLSKQFEENFTVERLTLAGEEAGQAGMHFRLRTSETDSEETRASKLSAEDRVSQKVNTAFEATDAMQLRKVTMSFTPVKTVDFAEGDDSLEASQNRRFNGGSASVITFSAEVAEGTIRDNLESTLQTLNSSDGNQFEDASSLFDISGLSGSGMEATAQSVRKFDKVTVRTLDVVSSDDLESVLSDMQSRLKSSPLFDEVNTFASAVASEMKQSAIMAIIVSLIAIVGYIWFRFQRITFGLAAVVALTHDVLIVLGMVAVASWAGGHPIGRSLMLIDFRINLPMVAAFLTIVGYSLNDTIVVFDRIREVRGKNPDLTAEIVNTSLNQTLSRTLLTSLTTFIVVGILYVIGGEGIHGFAFCLTLGILVGTYSSVYVASPVLIWLMNRNSSQPA
ncbi:MAG: protein translocase subunit SecD [Fuerstiella sp.]|nr:protein translocase subunit SecD [Fuerstiella sp.]